MYAVISEGKLLLLTAVAESATNTFLAYQDGDYPASIHKVSSLEELATHLGVEYKTQERTDSIGKSLDGVIADARKYLDKFKTLQSTQPGATMKNIKEFFDGIEKILEPTKKD